MDLIKAGIICREAGFNWGRGSWWGVARYTEDFYEKCWVQTEDIPFESIGLYLPLLTKGATRGVILEWVQHQVCDEKVHIGFCLGYYWVFSEKYTTERLDANSWHSAYARLCQWAKEELK